MGLLNNIMDMEENPDAKNDKSFAFLRCDLKNETFGH